MSRLRGFTKKLSEQRILFWGTYAILLLATIAVGAGAGMLLGYSLDLPRVEELADIRPNVVSYVYAEDGRVLGEFALEKRILVTYDQIPTQVRQAILAAEDAEFFEHSGINFRRFAAAMWRNVTSFDFSHGASTLTMQLCKLRFTSSEKRVERKIKDMLFALETEKKFSKEQIFTLYFNQIYMGHGIYGIAAAADFYFDRSLEDLTLAETATLAGVLNVPERFSPIRYPDRALRRRAYTLRRMREEGHIDQSEYDQALAEPLGTRNKEDRRVAPYFVEWVRQSLEQNYSTEKIWQGGLKIYTTLDYDLQVSAQKALKRGLKAYDKKHGPWEGAPLNILAEGRKEEDYRHADWRRVLAVGDSIHGLVEVVDRKSAQVKLGAYTAELDAEDVDWTGEKRLDRVFQTGDVALFEIMGLDQENKTAELRLDRVPEVQGAALTLDNHSGAMRAMVGGYDFRYSKFNRATQALRQPGSIFKPFTYVVALEEGRSPFERILDAPVNFVDALGRPYAPRNSDEKFKGLLPLQQALAESRNVPTIRLANALGIERIIEVAQRFGIKRDFVPVLPIALGAGEITLEEITSAFSAFANRGVRAKPYFLKRVEDFNGLVLEQHQPQFEQVLTPEIAGKMIYLLRQVVLRGTAWRAQALNRPVAGKTGTTNEATDTWFVGLTPDLTGGVWVGHDEKKTLGEEIFGANLALPIWVDFMTEAYEGVPAEPFEEIYRPTEEEKNAAAVVEQSLSGTELIATEEIPPPPPEEECEEGEEGEECKEVDPDDPTKKDPKKPENKDPKKPPRPPEN